MVELAFEKAPAPLLVRQENDIAAKTGKQHSNLKAKGLLAKTCHFSNGSGEGCEHQHWDHGVFGFLFKFLDSVEGFSGLGSKAQKALDET